MTLGMENTLPCKCLLTMRFPLRFQKTPPQRLQTSKALGFKTSHTYLYIILQIVYYYRITKSSLTTIIITLLYNNQSNHHRNNNNNIINNNNNNNNIQQQKENTYSIIIYILLATNSISLKAKKLLSMRNFITSLLHYICNCQS